MITSKVKWLIYTSNCSSIQSSSAIIWGRIHESTAFEMYESSIPQSMVLHKSGIYIYEDNGFLAASPDGILLMADSEVSCGIIEIKCPYTARNMTVQEACSNSKPFYCETVDGAIKLKKNHQYYYQVQGAMGIVGVEWCDFIIWTTKDMTVERTYFDKTFWRKCLEKLKSV